ncbi:HEAT repeat domain-containing protein [Rhodococcus zopfii]|uniref:HEAT repeat domain-containing protein n=1 Tax=Rhodococcus zopfii TaxID=43772 RepID=UPI003B8A73E1
MVVVNTTRNGRPDSAQVGAAQTGAAQAGAALVGALSAANASARLKAALRAGTDPDPQLVELLVGRCAVEGDFFVRDMLTWALCRMPVDITVPRLLGELRSGGAQARSQALHTLSKIRDLRAWPDVVAQLHDRDDDVARSAWRAAVALVPPGVEGELAADLATALGRGDRELQRSLSRALIGLGEPVLPVLDAAKASPDAEIRAHAEATEALYRDPDSAFALSVETAKRVAVTGPEGS